MHLLSVAVTEKKRYRCLHLPLQCLGGRGGAEPERMPGEREERREGRRDGERGEEVQSREKREQRGEDADGERGKERLRDGWRERWRDLPAALCWQSANNHG